MLRYCALVVVLLVVGCAEQPLDVPLDAQLNEVPESTSQAPALPASLGDDIASAENRPENSPEDSAEQETGEAAPKSKLGSIFNALKVGTAEAMDEAGEK